MAERRKGATDNSDVQPSAVIVVRVVPRSSRISIAQEGPDMFKVRLTAPPVEGAANAQLIKVLSAKLSLPAAQIHWISGQTARLKRLKIDGLALQEITTRLLIA